MLRTLLESARPHSIPLGSLAASVAVHIALSAPAWTGKPADEIRATPESFITRALFRPPPDRLPSRSAQVERLRWAHVGIPDAPGLFIPDALRPSELGGTLAARLAGAPAGSAGGDRPSADVVPGNDSAYSLLQVDEIVVRYADSAAPLYPVDLLEQSLEGDVRVRYVVDATGRVDTASVRVLRSTHPGFTASVLDALPRMRFHPATIASKPVNQVVEQDFGFRIEVPASDSDSQPTPDSSAPKARGR